MPGRGSRQAAIGERRQAAMRLVAEALNGTPWQRPRGRGGVIKTVFLRCISCFCAVSRCRPIAVLAWRVIDI